MRLHTLNSNKAISLILVSLFCTACSTAPPTVKETDKIFHAGPANDGFGVMFFGLYTDNKYQFCDGDFMDPGCYTGFYSLNGDTITLKDLKKHKGIPTNKFLIRRYKDMDSNYWQWKYPTYNWQVMRNKDSSIGSTGDVFPLNKENKIVFDINNYFLIRFDSLGNNP